MKDKVARLRALMADAVPRKVEPPDLTQRQFPAFEWFEANTTLTPIAQTPRARAEREISRITTWYQCSDELYRLLDREEASTLAELDDAALEDVLVQMRCIQDCAQLGLGSPHAPPGS